MYCSLEDFTKKHDKVICIDSDGTMIDAMNVKHHRCHGASLMEVFQLQDHAEEVQEMWDSINLYERTRGVNRFIALKIMIGRINGKYVHVDPKDYERYCEWVDAGNITNNDLKEEIAKKDSWLMRKALEWSEELNRRIEGVTEADKPPFDHAKEALAYAQGKCDIAIISSSNIAAITKEWGAYGLLDYVDVITSNEVGPKDICLAQLMKCGYGREDMLMLGDAYPDVDAAAANGIWYYPILTRHEGESWQELIDRYLDIFLSGHYDDVQEELLKRFEENFVQK